MYLRMQVEKMFLKGHFYKSKGREKVLVNLFSPFHFQ